MEEQISKEMQKAHLAKFIYHFFLHHPKELKHPEDRALYEICQRIVLNDYQSSSGVSDDEMELILSTISKFKMNHKDDLNE